MRFFPVTAFAFGILATACSAQTVSTAPSSAASASGGSTAQGAPMATYRNDALHLNYSYPASYTDASALVVPAFQATLGKAQGEAGAKNDRKAKDATRCVTLPFSVINSDNGYAVVLLLRVDAGCLKKTFTAADLPTFTRGEIEGLTASGARTQFSEPTAFTTEGHAAEWLRGSFQLPTGQSLQAMVACVLEKPDVVCWQFLGSSEANLRIMAAFPMSLDGAAPMPVVPATLFAKP